MNKPSSTRILSIYLISALLLVACFPFAALGSARLVGQQAPVKAFVDQLGREIRIEEGKPSIVYFWMVSCVPCSAMIPMLNRLYDTYSEKGLKVIGIGAGVTVPSTAKYKADKGVRYTLVPDPAGKVSVAFGITVTPTLYIIDGTGTVQEFKTGYVGQLDDAFIEGKVKQLLGLN